MKQNIILWISAVIIVFVAAYYKTVTSPYYPVSGSFGIEGEKITFKFDKISRGNEDYQVLIRTDKELDGLIEWSREGESEFHHSRLKFFEGGLTGTIPKQKAFSKVLYKIILIHKGDSIAVPRTEPVRLEFRNKISVVVNFLFYFFFFGGLLLSTRSGLEYFRNESKTGALTVFTLIFFTLYTFIISPLRNSYESGFLTDYIPKPEEIFHLKDMGYFLIWLAGIILFAAAKKRKVLILFASVVIIILFLLTGYNH